LTDLIVLNNNSIIKPKRFLKNLKELLISIDLIKVRYIESFIRTINELNRSK
jgi:hypothetical protein